MMGKAISLKVFILTSLMRNNKDELEKLLRASYTIESFRNTDIYTALNQWSVGNDMAILK